MYALLTSHLARDLPHKTGAGGATRERLLDTDNPNMGAVGKEVKGRTHTYYQVILCFCTMLQMFPIPPCN